MTERRDLKRRVRARQARTGESYVTALRHVQAERPPAFPTIELIDLTELGAPLGLKCRVVMFPQIAERVDVGAMLVRLRHALLATEGDRALALMRRVVLRGEGARMPPPAAAFAEARRFVARAKAGIGGVSESGRMLALQIDGRASGGAAAGAGGAHMLLFMLQLMPIFVPVHREPTLVITSLDAVTVDPMLALLEEAAMTRVR